MYVSMKTKRKGKVSENQVDFCTIQLSYFFLYTTALQNRVDHGSQLHSRSCFFFFLFPNTLISFWKASFVFFSAPLRPCTTLSFICYYTPHIVERVYLILISPVWCSRLRLSCWRSLHHIFLLSTVRPFFSSPFTTLSFLSLTTVFFILAFSACYQHCHLWLV